ncbi:DNA polymerase III subunit beta [Candidatus Curtissbacteria bacterium RIFCSPHIGHO2_02_FULL_42_15]|uniref:Beta sliding clamp n=1 Tax=Candidatus Curtissbacteria bacterium RIFCSPHIGHO2_02_FULL_42_15 TaxID=1797716 RepID=A0A1F5GHJ9_9BACT|nr:MAG: DNA polymerase III subunit beta [Candidatus Curtissbacteria bacterium RIFCSPHIGHO2_02_FULL_42_15]
MKFRVSQEDLAKALSACSRSTGAKSNLPILSNILVNCSKNNLEVTSTNLETAIKIAIPCIAEKEGKTTLPGRTLFEFVPQLPEGEITVEKLGEEVLLSTKGYSARLATMAADEFPAIPKIASGKELKIKARDFSKNVQKVEYCASQDESRPALTGVLCELEKRGFLMVATDGYRLSFSQIVDAKSAQVFKLIIPASALSELAKIITETESAEGEQLTILVASQLNQVEFKIGGIEFTTRTIEGEYPGWQKIIPSAFGTKAKIQKADFVKQLRIASIFARDAGNIVKLNLKEGQLTIFANTSQVGSNEITTEARIEGPGGEIAFNFRYLLEALSAIEGEDVLFEMGESLTPARLKSTESKDPSFHIIMPVRLQS